jgi:phosphoketolase
VTKLNNAERNFRIFGPDETLSNGLEAVFEVTKRHLGFFVHDMVDEARILVCEAVVILSPDMRGQ